MDTAIDISLKFAAITVAFVVVLLIVAYTVLAERRILGFIQGRLGPNRVGYGGMLTESFVAIMALCAACVLDPGIYFAMNSPAAAIGDTPQRAAEVISNWGWVITPDTITQTAADVGERTILNRAGGAPWETWALCPG